MLTPDQLQLYSREWRDLFARMQAQGYEITYQSGTLAIRSAEHRIDVKLHEGRWRIELLSPVGHNDSRRPRFDWHAIQTIEMYLNWAREMPNLYNFAMHEATQKGHGRAEWIDESPPTFQPRKRKRTLVGGGRR